MICKHFTKLFFFIFFIGIQNNCFSQQGYVLFGDPGKGMCRGTGICNAVNAPLPNATSAIFYVAYYGDGYSSLLMDIDMTSVFFNDPVQYQKFLTGSYPFTSGVIPKNVLDNFGVETSTIDLPVNSTVRVTNLLPNPTTTQRQFIEIDLGDYRNISGNVSPQNFGMNEYFWKYRSNWRQKYYDYLRNRNNKIEK
jgi:hypothetical protein